MISEPAEIVTEYGDDDLTFFALLHQDYADAELCLPDLRRHYPGSQLILRSDGDSDPRYAALAKRYDADLHYEPRLFGIENGGAVVERMLKLFLRKPTRYLFKIDPDTVIHRRFGYLPARSGVFGTPQGPAKTPSIQGGCMGFTLDAARRLLESGMLKDERLSHPSKFVENSPYFHRMAHRANRCGLASFDWTLPWIASELDIPLFAFDEVMSGWGQAPPNPDLRYAVTHPR